MPSLPGREEHGALWKGPLWLFLPSPSTVPGTQWRPGDRGEEGITEGLAREHAEDAGAGPPALPPPLTTGPQVPQP